MAGQDMAEQGVAKEDAKQRSSVTPPDEAPTAAASLTIRLIPFEMEVKATIPTSEARFILGVFAMVGTGLIGTAAAILTLYFARGLAVVALIELVLTFAVVTFIAFIIPRRRTRARRKIKRPSSGPGTESVSTRERSS